jgi:hypothetical protein
MEIVKEGKPGRGQKSAFVEGPFLVVRGRGGSRWLELSGKSSGRKRMHIELKRLTKNHPRVFSCMLACT